MPKPSYATLVKAVEQFVDACDVRLGQRVPGKALELHEWLDVRHQVLFKGDYPALYRVVEWLEQSATPAELEAQK